MLLVIHIVYDYSMKRTIYCLFLLFLLFQSIIRTVPAHLSALPVEANLKTSDLPPSDVPRPGPTKTKGKGSDFFDRLVMFIATTLIAMFTLYDLQIGVTTVIVGVVLLVSCKLLEMLFSPRKEFVRDSSIEFE